MMINVMEIVLTNLLEKYWTSLNMSCHCDECKMDVLAIALNQVPPRYISKKDSMAFVKAEFLDKQSETNLLVQISSAARKVAESPRCENAKKSR